MDVIDPLFSRTPCEGEFSWRGLGASSRTSRCPFYMDLPVAARARSSLRPRATLLEPDASVSTLWRVGQRRAAAHNPNNALFRRNDL